MSYSLGSRVRRFNATPESDNMDIGTVIGLVEMEDYPYPYIQVAWDQSPVMRHSPWELTVAKDQEGNADEDNER